MSLRVWLPLDGDLRQIGTSGITATAIGTLTYTAGKVGQCYQRANSSSQLTNGLQLDNNLLDILGTQASIAVWVKPLGTHTHYNGTIISSGNWNAKRWAFGVSQDNSKVDVLCGSHNNYITCAAPVNEWTHLASTFDNGICKLYKNGTYVGQLTGQAAFASEATWTGVGRETYAGGYFGFNGCINDLRIYDEVLSDAQIHEISQGLVLHYKLDDLENGVLDSSGYGHDGTTLNTVSLSNETCRYSSSISLPNGNSAINCGRGGMMTDSITVNMWLKSSSWANPVSCTESGGWNFEASGDYFRFTVYISGVGYRYGKSTLTRAQICDNQWHMLTGIYDRINQKVQIYVDGELDNDYAAGTSNNIGYNGSNVIWIGAEASSSATGIASNGMTGLFSDFRIYCTPLSANDILALYHTSAKIDNKQNLHTFELEEAGGPELLAIPLTTSYGNRTNIYTTYNDDGEITLTGSSSIGSNYIPISPTGKVYYFDIDVSIDAGNQFYIGFERFDVDKAATSNSSCDYVVNVKPSSALVHQHYFGTRTWTGNLSTGKPPAYIALRILNDWSGANGRKATIHSISLREVTTLTTEQILKTGITRADEFIEGEKAAIQQNKIISSENFIEL